MSLQSRAITAKEAEIAAMMTDRSLRLHYFRRMHIVEVARKFSEVLESINSPLCLSIICHEVDEELLA